MNVQKSLRNGKSGKPPRHRERPASGMRKGAAGPAPGPQSTAGVDNGNKKVTI